MANNEPKVALGRAQAAPVLSYNVPEPTFTQEPAYGQEPRTYGQEPPGYGQEPVGTQAPFGEPVVPPPSGTNPYPPGPTSTGEVR